jgi:hypothetical protein
MQILDHGLELAAVALRDTSPEDRGDFVRLPDRSIGIQEPLAEAIESRPPMEDQVVAVLDLRDEQPVLTAGPSTFPVGKERGESREPLLPAAHEIAGGQGIGEFLQPLRLDALQEGVDTLLKADAFGAELIRQPVMLIQTDPGGEGKVWADPDEHPSPEAVGEVEVVLHDPALRELQMPAVVRRVPDGDQDPGRFSTLENPRPLRRASDA